MCLSVCVSGEKTRKTLGGILLTRAEAVSATTIIESSRNAPNLEEERPLLSRLRGKRLRRLTIIGSDSASFYV